MLSDLANLGIGRIIVHEVHRRAEDRAPVQPRLSADFTKLEEEGIDTLRQRIIDVLGTDSNCIEMVLKDSEPGSVYEICNQMVGATDSVFKQGSNSLAAKLTGSQLSRNIPGGILIVFSGKVGTAGSDYVGIIKAEPHSGFSLAEKSDKLLLEFLVNLLLTPHQKFYKIAMLISTAGNKGADTRTPEDFRILVYDHLMRSSPSGDAARYFFEGFLGCQPMPTAKKLTKDFYTLTKEFIAGLAVDGEDKVDYMTYLYTYMKGSQRKTIKAAEFAETYFPPKFQDSFRQFMRQNSFPAHAVQKDLTYVGSNLKKRHVRFTSDVRISAPAEDFGELVKMKPEEDGHTVVTISGRVDSAE